MEANKKCEQCLWADQCQESTDCGQFTSIDEDGQIEAAIERGRREFRHIYYIYVKDYK